MTVKIRMKRGVMYREYRDDQKEMIAGYRFMKAHPEIETVSEVSSDACPYDAEDIAKRRDWYKGILDAIGDRFL